MRKSLKETKKQAYDIIVKSAKIYTKRLLDKNIIFITMKSNKKIEVIETVFLRENFLHLTGIQVDKTKISAKDFFERCINNKISLKDFELKDNTTTLKLQILPMLVSIDVTANILGDFDNSKMLLQTKKIAGNISACMGFQYYKNMNKYIPNTALKEDIRNITTDRSRIVAIMKKDKSKKLYDNVTYIAKNINIYEILNNEIVKPKVDFKNLYSDKDNYNNILSQFIN